jgi:hypothetical protein
MPLIDETVSVDRMVDTITSSFMTALDKHAPIKQKRVKPRVQPVWFNVHIKSAILARNREKKKGNLADYRKLRNKVISMIKKAKTQHYHNALTTSKGNSKMLWRNMRELTGNKSKNTPKVIALDGELCSDTKTIANEFNTFFTHVADNILQSQSNINKKGKYVPPDILKESIASKLPHDIKFSIPYATEEQIMKALKSLDVDKATGIDDISAKYIRMSAPVLARHLCIIINNSIKTGVFPNLWKHAKVFPVFKSGQQTDMNNYRPISILTILSKIIEKHVHDAFYEFLSKYDLLSVHQSGFRKHHSCETGLATLISEWHKHIDNNKLIGCINIDLRKAFDLVNFNVLCDKLKLYGCNDNAHSWFHSYLTNRKQVVCIDDCKSTTSNVSHGVPKVQS